MVNSHSLQIAPEVAARLPGEVVDRFTNDPTYEELTCVCGKLIAPGAPAALVVLHDPGLDFTHVSATHPACQTSAVLEADLTHLAVPSGGHNLTITASLLRDRSPARKPGKGFRSRPAVRQVPAISVGTNSAFQGSNPSGELTDLIIMGALKAGLNLVTKVGPDLDPPTRSAWLALIDPLGAGEYALRILDPDATALVSEGRIYAPWPEWERLIERDNAVNLYVGSFLTEPSARPTLLAELAAAGRLAGARIPALVGPVAAA